MYKKNYTKWSSLKGGFIIETEEQTVEDIKRPVKKLTKEITQKYVSEIIKEAIKKALKKQTENLDEKEIAELEKKINSFSENKRIDIFKESKEDVSKFIYEDHLKNKELFDKVNSAFSTTLEKQVPFLLSAMPLAIKIVLVTIALVPIFMLALPLPKPVLSLSPNLSSHDFGEISKGDSASWEFSIRNAGDETLNWNIVDNQPWITVNPQKGTNSGSAMINIDTSDLKLGDHSGTITINSNGGDSSGNINVEVIQGPSLFVSPDLSHDFGQINQGDSTSWDFSIWNTGDGTLNWSIVDNQPWITVNPQKGTNSGIVTVEVNTVDLDNGYYSDTITINSNGGNESGKIEMDVIQGPSLLVSPALSHDFGQITKGDSTSWDFSIWNTGDGTLNWSIVDNQPWITVNPQKGTNSGIVTVEVNTVDLDYGYYSDTISINSNGGDSSGKIEMDVIKPVLLGPDLVVSTFKTTGSATINAENSVVLPVQVIIKNQGDSDASLFKVATGYTGKSGSYVIAFTVKGQDNLWYPYTSTSLKPEETVTFNGIVTFHSSIHNEAITLWAVADSCSGDEFKPNYCRVDESDEENNYSPSISIFLP